MLGLGVEVGMERGHWRSCISRGILGEDCSGELARLGAVGHTGSPFQPQILSRVSQVYTSSRAGSGLKRSLKARQLKIIFNNKL